MQCSGSYLQRGRGALFLPHNETLDLNRDSKFTPPNKIHEIYSFYFLLRFEFNQALQLDCIRLTGFSTTKTGPDIKLYRSTWKDTFLKWGKFPVEFNKCRINVSVDGKRGRTLNMPLWWEWGGNLNIAVCPPWRDTQQLWGCVILSYVLVSCLFLSFVDKGKD